MPEDTPAEAPERVTETWTCAGTRVNTKDRRVVAWVTSDARTRNYQDARSYVLGGRYEFTVSHADDGNGGTSTTFWGKPRYLGTRETDRELLATWTGRTLAAEAELRINALERKHKGENPVDPLIEPLLEYARKMRSGPERTTFLAYVIDHIQKGW